MGGAHGRRARRRRAGDRRAPARTARGGERDRRSRDGQGDRVGPRRDRRSDRDGLLRRGRGPALVRTHDDSVDAASNRADPAKARRRRGPPDLVQHAAAERRLEGVPVDLLRQRIGAEALGAHARVGMVARSALPRGRTAAGRAERRPGARTGGGDAARRGPARRSRLVHRLGRHRPADSRGSRTPSREDRDGAGWEERARRLRRRRPRPRRRVDPRVGLLERRSAVRRGEPDRRVRRRLRRLPRAPRARDVGARGHRAGHLRGCHGQDPGRGRGCVRRRRGRARGRRAGR